MTIAHRKIVHQTIVPFAEMQRLYSVGHSLIPLGGGGDGKSPIAQFQGRKRLPINVATKRMADKGSTMYGVRLEYLIVVDADTNNPQTTEYINERFGCSTVQVSSPRGVHHYFRRGDSRVPKKVRLPNIEIDIKSGANSYVAGAGSIRPDGGEYVAAVGSLASVASLPLFKDSRPDIATAPLVNVGGRTFYVWDRAREFLETSDSVQGLFEELQSVRDWELASPETYSDAKLLKAANWAWKLRLNNSVWGGLKSVVKTHHSEFEAIMGQPNGELGLVLLHVLRHNHEGKARKGKPFCIARVEMAKSQVIAGWNQHHYRRAKKALLDANLIHCVKAGNKYIGASTYLFGPAPYQGEEGFILHTGGSRTTENVGSI